MVKIQLKIDVYRLMAAVKVANVVALEAFPWPGSYCPHCRQRLETIYGYESRVGDQIYSCSVMYCECGQFAVRTPLTRERQLT